MKTFEIRDRCDGFDGQHRFKISHAGNERFDAIAFGRRVYASEMARRVGIPGTWA